jgi:hypothetical protein
VSRLCLLWKRENALGLLGTLLGDVYSARWRVWQQEELYQKPLPSENTRRRAVVFRRAAELRRRAYALEGDAPGRHIYRAGQRTSIKTFRYEPE